MLRTSGLYLASFALVIGVGFGFFLAGLFDFNKLDSTQYRSEPPVTLEVADHEFRAALISALTVTEANEYTPQAIMTAFPALIPADFHGVDAVVGGYTYREGTLEYSNQSVTDGHASDLAPAGYKTLRANVLNRLTLPSDMSTPDLIVKLKEPSTNSTPPPPIPAPGFPDEPVFCAQEAKLCPDGSYVGRTGPNCEFASCGSTGVPSDQEILCTPEQRAADACIEIYAPVCATERVECVTTPCDPVPTTYPNSCFACAEKRVISYTDGACYGDPPSE